MQNKRHRFEGLLALVAALLLATATAHAQIAAFPGAMGFGAQATGGRGGSVYHVITLADSGPGSFRDAVSASNRIVVFDVSGYITLTTAVSVKSNITIAGETAPGEGIGIKGGEVSFANSKNIICRYLRIRPGSETASTSDDALSFYRSTNVIVDHCSIEFAPWNNIDGVSDDWQNYPVNNITVQNSLIADPTGQQFGAHTEAVEGTWSWFNNIFANSHNRNPLAKINTVFINNVLYNCSAGYTTHTSTNFKHDIINNYFILGPASGSPDNSWFQIDKNQSIYYSGNLKDSLLDGTLNGGTTTPFWYQGDGTILTQPWSDVSSSVAVKTTPLAYYYNVSRSGDFPHDELDRLILSQVKTLGSGTVGTGAGTAGPDGGLYTSQEQTGLGNNGYGAIQTGTPDPDADHDGMPDYWELATGSNPQADDAMQAASDGYALIEHYLHFRAALHAATLMNTPVTVDLTAFAGAFSGMTVTYSLTGASHGTVELKPDAKATVFTPATDFSGLAQFFFSVTGGGVTYNDTVEIAVSRQPAIEAPSDLTLSAVTRDVANPYGVITIGWKDNSANETGFSVERAGSDGVFSVIKTTDADVTGYLDSASVVPGTTYQYRVRAVNDKDSSFYTPADSVQPALPPQPPTAANEPGPSNGATASLAAGATALSWTAGENTDSFTVYLGTTPDNLSPKDSFPATQLTYQATGLSDGADYYWRVDAKNKKGVTQGAVWSFHTAGAQVTTEDGLVGYWSLDDMTGSTVTDSSAYQDNGVIGLDPSDASIHVDGHRNKALDLKSLADNAYGIKIPNQPQLLLDKSSFTISFWVKADPSLMPQDNNTDQYLLCKGSIGTDATIGSTGKRIDLECKNKTLRFALDDANDANGGGKDELTTDASPVYTGQWVNVILMRDSADKQMRIYVNGSQVAEKAISKSTSGTGEASALILGNIGERELAGGKTTPAPFRGMFDEVKIYNYALTEGQVYQLSEHYPQGIIGYWSFDESGSTTVVTDSSAYRDDGALGLDPTDASIRVSGHRGNGLDFATMKDNSYGVRIPDQGQLNLDKSAFSISFWMKAPESMFPTSNDMDYYVLCKGSIGTNPDIGSTGKRFDLEFKNKTMRFAIDDANDANGGGKDELSTDATPFFTGDWVNVVLIRDTADQQLKVYLNATLVGEKGISKALSGIGEASDLILGNIGERELLSGTATPAPYKGMLDEFKIYNYALSYTDVVTEYYGSPVALKPFNPSYNNVTADGYDDTLRLTWDGGANTTKFQLYMGSDSANMQLVEDSIDVNTPLYLLTNIKPQSAYYWRVDAVGILGTTQGDTWAFTTGLPKGLVAHYAFDASSGTLITDSSDYHNDGMLKGQQQAAWFPGKYNNAFALGSSAWDTSVVDVPQAPQIRFDNSSFTVSLWVSLPAYDADNKVNAYIFQKGTMENVDAGTGKWYGLQLKDKTLTFAVDDGIHKASAGVSVAAGSKFDLFNQGWKHIVVLRDRSIDRIRIYIDGVLTKSVDDASVTGTIGKDADLLIGNSPEQIPFRDSLDDIRIYNYALSEALIHKLDAGIPLLQKVVNPTPADSSVGAGPEKVLFGWQDPTATALSYQFFLGLSPDSLTLLATGLDSTGFEADTLLPETTYYWRVDDSSDVERVPGEVWSFTTGKDTLGPKIVLKPVSVQLGASGSASITAEMVDSATTDEYGIDTLWVEKYDFSCPDLGNNKVLFSARDHYGNISTDTARVLVTGNKPPMPAISPEDTTICQGDLIRLHATRDSTTDRYVWSLPGQQTFQKTSDSLLPVNAPGAYRVVAISAQSCPSDTSEPITVHISADTTLDISSDLTIQRGSSVTLTASGSDGTISWSPDIAISPVTGTSVTVNPMTDTRYTATLTNTLGCLVTRSVNVTVNSSFQAAYNRIVTPNGDGINDKLIIDRLSGYPNNRLQIFDESGKLIYQKNGYSNDWDGRVKGRLVAKGSYYFVLFIDHQVKIKGSFTVIH